MKICLVADYIPGRHRKWSGAEIFCFRLYEKLRASGADARIFSTPFDKLPAAKDTENSFVQIHSLFGYESKLNKILRPLCDPFSVAEFFLKVRKFRPDIIHIHSKHLLIPALILARLLGIKTVYVFLDYFLICHKNTFLKEDGSLCENPQGADCADCSMHIFKGVPFWFLIRAAMRLIAVRRTLLTRLAARKIDRFIALTEAGKKRAVRHGIPENKIEVCYYYTPSERQDAARALPRGGAQNYFGDKTKKYVLFVGTVSYHKGLEVLVEAMASVRRARPEIKLMACVGDAVPSHLEKIRRMVKDLALEDIVTFLPKMSNDEVMEALAAADIVVVPEQWPNEFGPVILVEALYSGKPVVASRIGGVGEFIVEGVNGYTFPPRDAKVLADKILKVLSDESLREKAAAHGGKGLFELPMFKRDILAIYKELLDEGRPA